MGMVGFFPKLNSRPIKTFMEAERRKKNFMSLGNHNFEKL
jgi:hypothetical protein